MKNSELKDIVIKEVLRGFESAYLGLDERLEESKADNEERAKAIDYLYNMQQNFIKKYVK